MAKTTQNVSKTREGINSLYVTRRDDMGFNTLTIEDVRSAVAMLDSNKPLKKILERIEICKKHWKQLEKEAVFKKSEDWGGLSGVTVVVKPHIKKARLFYKYL